jgi:hypothetical protein
LIASRLAVNLERRPSGEGSQLAQRRKVVALEAHGARTGGRGDLLEEGGLEMKREAAITLAVLVSAGKALASASQ